MRIGVSSHGRNWLSSRAAGRMMSSLLRSEPSAMRLMIGSSRSGVEALHVARRHGGVVDDDAGGLGAGAARGGADVVDRGGRQLGERRDVVEQGDESTSHWTSPPGRGAGAPPRAGASASAHGNADPASPGCACHPGTSTVGHVQRHEISHARPSPPPRHGAPVGRIGRPAPRAPRPTSGWAGARPRLRQRAVAAHAARRARRPHRRRRRPPPRRPGGARAATGGRGSLEAADATTWRGGAFDAVVAVGVAHVFGGPGGTLDAARRHLAPGGRVLLGDGIWDTPPTEAALARARRRPGGVPRPRRPRRPGARRTASRWSTAT